MTPICRKCKTLWKSEGSLGWYEMKPPSKGSEFNVLDGPYCFKCAKEILVEREQS